MKHKRLTLIAIAIALIISSPAARPQTQSELNDQSYKDYKKADDELNTVYTQLLHKLDEPAQKKLRLAEKAWIAFRDAECESEADEYRGGSIQPLIRNSCAQRLTAARTADLKDRLTHLGGR